MLQPNRRGCGHMSSSSNNLPVEHTGVGRWTSTRLRRCGYPGCGLRGRAGGHLSGRFCFGKECCMDYDSEKELTAGHVTLTRHGCDQARVRPDQTQAVQAPSQALNFGCFQCHATLSGTLFCRENRRLERPRREAWDLRLFAAERAWSTVN